MLHLSNHQMNHTSEPHSFFDCPITKIIGKLTNTPAFPKNSIELLNLMFMFGIFSQSEAKNIREVFMVLFF